MMVLPVTATITANSTNTSNDDEDDGMVVQI